MFIQQKDSAKCLGLNETSKKTTKQWTDTRSLARGSCKVLGVRFENFFSQAPLIPLWTLRILYSRLNAAEYFGIVFNFSSWFLKKMLFWGKYFTATISFLMTTEGSNHFGKITFKKKRVFFLVKSFEHHYLKVNLFLPFPVTCSWYNDVWYLNADDYPTCWNA